MKSYKHSKFLFVVIGGILLFSVYYLVHHYQKANTDTILWKDSLGEEKNESAQVKTSEPNSNFPTSLTKEERVWIDIKGAVKKPGVYSFTQGARVMDAIAKAGGFIAKADERKVNLAQKLTDEMVVYIPLIGEDSAEPFTSVEPDNGSAKKEGKLIKVNINSATVDELETLTGIGPTKAQAIIDYRTQNGPFQKVEDILNVTGIGEKSLDKMKESIVLR